MYSDKSGSHHGSVEIAEHGGHAATSRSDARDNIDLLRTGKKPVLKRKFGFMSILGFSCLALGTWISSFILFGIGYYNGGPSGLVYGLLLVWAGTLATFVSLAELASMAPTAGGQYHWVSLLAPASMQKIMSYITGWLTVLGWETSIASSAFITGGLWQNFILLVDSSYTPQLWHTTLLYYAALAFVVLVIYGMGPHLAKIESGLLVLYVMAFVAILIPLIYLAPHGSGQDVFDTFINAGNWPTMGVSFMVGLSGNAFAFSGADSIYHMSEEIHDAARVVPRAIVTSLIFNGVVGLASMIAVLFCLGNPDDILSTDFDYPFIQVFLQATHSVAGSAVMVIIIIIMDMGAIIGLGAAATRMLWSFSRDKGVPGWSWLSKVNPKTSIPERSILITIVFCVLIGLISIGSPVAFNDVVSLALAALYASYFCAVGLLFWRRLSGSIKVLDMNMDSSEQINLNVPGKAGHLVWGPWRVPEPLGTIINGFACIYLIVIFFFAFWPPAIPVTPDTMNFACVVFGAVAILSAVYYAAWGRKTFKGPTVEIEHAGMELK